MPRKYLIALVAVVVLALAVWLVPMALAAVNGSSSPQASPQASPSQGSGTTHTCPGGGDWNSNGSTSGSSSSGGGASYQAL